MPDEASLDDEAANESLGGDQLIIDVQTHYFASRPASQGNRDLIRTLYPLYGPDWWEGLSKVQVLDFVEYLRCVYLESDTAVAVLSSAPGLTDERMLFNDEMADPVFSSSDSVRRTACSIMPSSILESMARLRKWLRSKIV